MSLRNTTSRYGSVSIILHWLMLALIIAVYAAIELRDLYPTGSGPREAFKAWHFMLGLSVFFLVWLRLLFRLISPTPQISPPISRWQSVAAKLIHFGLYFVMIITPLLGWMILSSAGKPLLFFGFELPALVAENKNLAKIFKERHEMIAEVGYYLIGLHAAAALFHHYVIRDNTLLRILPQRG
jgi:cytochrome b561